jgi:diguanylate cyclase (GGDEF)-like protein
MMASRLMPARARPSVVGVLGILGWVVIVLAGGMGFVLSPAVSGEANESLLFASLTFFFLVIIARVVVAAVRQRSRRAPLIALLAGIVLWALGSVTLNGESPEARAFPAPGEWLFVSSYLAFAAFLVLDVSHKRGRNMSAWLDAAIMVGAVGAVSGALLLTPFVNAFPEGGIPLLVAILFPLIDVTLALVVIGQWALSSRAWSRSTASLIVGFVVLAIADSSLVLNLASGTYAFSTLLAVLWGVAFMLISDGAVSTRPPIVTMARRLPVAFLATAFSSAVLLLVIRPDGLLGWAIAVPAAVTLFATGARLVVALQESRKASEAFQMAQTDDLTGLPNRRAVITALDQGIVAQQPMGLVLLDLDGFKEVNDTLGHSAGDTLLELVALRMRDSLPSDILLARLGGDEFAMVVPHDDELDLLERAQAVRQTLLAPAKVDGMDLAMHASLGITVREAGDTRAADLLRRADVAMYEAKVTRSGAQLYDAQRDEFSRQRLRMGEELRRALSKGQIITWYQPKVDAVTQMAVGMEALVRWQHPDRGMIPPMAFLSVARRAGLMLELSQVVAQRAVADARHWKQLGLDLNVAINLAPPELLGGEFLPVLYDLIDDAGLPMHVITVEVTEDTFLADPERARDILLDVRRHGLKTSIDDYGTGFSSLAYLRDLPVTELKMDRSFVSTLTSDERSRLIVASTIDMAHALDLRVVAEGVENAAVTAEVIALGVDVLQGYHLAAPMPGDQVEQWVRDWNENSMTGRSAPAIRPADWRDSSAS